MSRPQATPREALASIFATGLAAADPARLFDGRLPDPPRGRTVVVGAGKASAAMCRAFEQAWAAAGHEPPSGLVVTRYGHAVPCRSVAVVEAAHPVPDAAGQEAARRILSLAGSLGPDDLLVALISGGGSALLSLPVAGVTPEEKRDLSRALLRSGAPIAAMNCVRRHLSAVKGGRLAVAAAPARVVTYLISDVPGDDPAAIASGPTCPDASTLAEARAVLETYGIAAPDSVRAALADSANETPKPGHPAFERASTVMLATAQDALEAAAAEARRLGYTPMILGDAIEGEAREVGRVLAAVARQARRRGQPAAAPLALLSGGETTVTVRGSGGRGGRNVEFLLGLALALDGEPGIHALACDTDGIDGTEDNAGAVVTPDTLARMRAAAVDPAGALARNDAYAAFTAVGDLVMTGPTLTNVNDLRVILVEGDG